MNNTREDTLETILSAHASALNQGADNTEWLTEKFRPQYPDLPVLLLLARQLKRALVPIDMRPEAAERLRNLLVQDEAEIISTAERKRWVWWGAAAAGSLIAGVAGFLFWRRGRLLDGGATAVLK